MADPPSNAGAFAKRWETLGTGADLWATVVMASGFVLPAGQEVREHYRIMRVLGQGGMGQVLVVSLVGSTDQQLFALKMVARAASSAAGDKSPDPADALAADAQAKAFAALLRGEAAKQDLVQRHGVSVARLFALARFEDGSLGLRMEIARGHSLEEFLLGESKRAAERPDLDYCLVVSRKLLSQLRRLHELTDPSSPTGFVHSDIKPGNVFVDDADRFDPFVTLLDFGVATAGHALGGDAAARGAGRATLILQDAGGTFGFAPPHHFTGKPTPLSDVYASLVILYEMIALKSPWDFGGLPKSAANLFKIEDAMRKGPRPVCAARPSIAPGVGEALDRFFAAEFGSLNALADEAHAARGGNDEDARRAMAERLRGLAQDYQHRIEALRRQFTGGVSQGSDPGNPPPPVDPALANTQAVPPARMSDPGPTRVEVTPSRKAAAGGSATSASESDELDEPVRVPMRPLVGWRSLVFVALLAGTGAWIWTNGVPAPVERFGRSMMSRAGDAPSPPEAVPPAPVVTAPVENRVDASAALAAVHARLGAAPDAATLAVAHGADGASASPDVFVVAIAATDAGAMPGVLDPMAVVLSPAGDPLGAPDAAIAVVPDDAGRAANETAQTEGTAIDAGSVGPTLTATSLAPDPARTFRMPAPSPARSPEVLAHNATTGRPTSAAHPPPAPHAAAHSPRTAVTARAPHPPAIAHRPPPAAHRAQPSRANANHATPHRSVTRAAPRARPRTPTRR